MFKKSKADIKEDLKFIEEVYTNTWEPLYRYVYFNVQNREEAEDITQETYVKALRHLKQTSVVIENHLSYLKTISLNIIRDRWRKKSQKGTNISFDVLNPGDSAVDDPAEESTNHVLLRKELDALNQDQRTVLELRILKGLSVAETARLMMKKEGAVRVLQYRALQTLASRIRIGGFE